MFAIIATIALFVYAVLGLKKPAIALLTVPAACFALGYAAVSVDAPENILYSVALFLVVIVSVVISGSQMDSPRWPQKLAKLILLSLFIFILLIISIIAVYTFHAVGFVLLLLCLGGVGLTVVAVGYGMISRQATDVYILSTLGAAMRQNLPLPLALESAASGRNDKRARILRSIQKWLVQGYSLSEAIKRGYRRCPGHAVAMITAAERMGQLPWAFRAIEADMMTKVDERRALRPVHPLYPLIVMSFLFFLASGLVKFVLPQYKAVLAEMFEGQKLPAPTRFMAETLGSIFWGYSGLIWLILAWVALVSVIVWVRTRIRPRRPDRPYLLSRIGDFLKWHLPILHWFQRNYSMVQVVELIRLSLNSGHTVNEAIRDTLSLDVNNRFRRLLKKWLEKVERGDNISNAVRQSGLGDALAWAFDDKINQGNTLAVLEMLESFYRSNYSYKVNLARFILWPCGIIAMGSMVGFVVYATYSPVVALVRHLAENIYP